MATTTLTSLQQIYPSDGNGNHYPTIITTVISIRWQWQPLHSPSHLGEHTHMHPPPPMLHHTPVHITRTHHGVCIQLLLCCTTHQCMCHSKLYRTTLWCRYSQRQHSCSLVQERCFPPGKEALQCGLCTRSQATHTSLISGL